MILLAPLHGLTDFAFRHVYSKYYSGIDDAVSPFISLTHGVNGYPIIAKEVLPANNKGIPVIPQVIGNNPVYFIKMAAFLHEWGYEQLNWNLGCPVKNIIRKKRGSGLLPHPDLIRDILGKTIPHIPQKLSIKIRLGLNDANEIYSLIPVLNDFPLESITIHPRIGIQLYDGDINHAVLQDCLPLFKHKIIYNGDIFSYTDFNKIKTLYPTIHHWMLGRGVLYNPLLPAVIKGEVVPPEDVVRKKYLAFLLELYAELSKTRNEPQQINKIKDFWQHFKNRFVDTESAFKRIAHVYTLSEIMEITKSLVEGEEMKVWNR